MPNEYFGYMTGQNYVSPKDKKYASKTRAFMARDVWEDYQSRFEPYEGKLSDAITGEQMLDERLQAISINNASAFQAAKQAQDMNMGRYGVKQTAVQSDAADRSLQQQSTLSEINSKNKTRTHIDDRDMNVLAGSGSRQAIQDI